MLALRVPDKRYFLRKPREIIFLAEGSVFMLKMNIIVLSLVYFWREDDYC